MSVLLKKGKPILVYINNDDRFELKQNNKVLLKGDRFSQEDNFKLEKLLIKLVDRTKTWEHPQLKSDCEDSKKANIKWLKQTGK